ncbi:AraC family transcriptional regulator [Vibrio sp. WXL103]|uniref:AraC family transcriptional regulator n=1 Tax=Vibrio sp. WXL103 TaxID=3450710 RepID=UPI003EC75B86
MTEQFSYHKSLYTKGLNSFSARMKEFCYGKHAHEEYSIGVTCRGRQDFFSNGTFHKSNAGNVIFFNPEQVHDGHAGAGQEMEYQMLYIPESRLINLMKTVGKVTNDQARLKVSSFQDTMLREQVFSLTQMLNRPQACSSLEEELHLIGIAKSIVRIGGGQPTFSGSSNRADILIKRAKEFIHDNLHQKISVEEIAKAASLSKYHFIRLFNQQYGMTPHQYVISYKINRAKHQLELGTNPTDIAMQYGFSDLSHLNRNFKNTFGITPNQYRKQLFL